MGKPAVSFFPGPLLSVDRSMVEEERMLHSRDPNEIASYLESVGTTDRTPDRRRCLRVREEVSSLVQALIDDPEDPELDSEPERRKARLESRNGR